MASFRRRSCVKCRATAVTCRATRLHRCVTPWSRRSPESWSSLRGWLLDHTEDCSHGILRHRHTPPRCIEGWVTEASARVLHPFGGGVDVGGGKVHHPVGVHVPPRRCHLHHAAQSWFA